MRLPLILLLIASAAAAQTPPVPPAEPTTAPAAPTAPNPAAVRVVLTTGDGPITIELAPDKAPATSANFLRYVDQ